MMVRFVSEEFHIWTIILTMLFPKNSGYVNTTHVHTVYRPCGSWADMCIAVFCHPHLRWCILSLQGTARPHIQLLLKDKGWQIKLSAYSCARRHCVFQYTSWKSTWSGDHQSHCYHLYSGDLKGDNGYGSSWAVFEVHCMSDCLSK